MEDIWIGSLVFRQPPSRPVTYIALSERDDHTLVSDGWGLRVARSAILVHSKNHQRGVQLARFLAIDDFMRSSSCNLELAVDCAMGCRAFLTRGEAEAVGRSETFAKVWGDRVDNASFCTGSQRGASFCRVGTAQLAARRSAAKVAGRGADGASALCQRKPKDLLKESELWPPVQARAQAALNSTSELQRLADAASALYTTKPPAPREHGRTSRGRRVSRKVRGRTFS